MRRLTSLLALAVLAGCVRVIPPPRDVPPVAQPAPTPAPVPTPAPPALRAGPSVTSLALTEGDAGSALRSFVESCPQLLARTDNSGLTVQNDWRPACSAASTWPTGQATTFFRQFFETAEVAGGDAFATGYYEPEIAGSREPRAGYDVPVYRLPPDLIRAWPADTPEAERTGRAPLGRYDDTGAFVPYFERGEIDEGALASKGLEIGWAADAIELFFLQIQGSGRLRTSGGEVIRIGYAGQNGRDYVGIGGVMRERGLIGDQPGQYSGSMQGIVQYLRDNPEEGRALMRENKSWIFFRELTGDGPLGALGAPVRARSSVAADPAYTPLGAPVWLAMDRADANGLWIAQDTGGAIKGANRFDTFWGAGTEAARIAGGMSARGRALLFLPKGTLARRARQ